MCLNYFSNLLFPLLLSTILLSAQTPHLGGNIDISLANSQLSGAFFLTNLEIGSTDPLTFLLNDSFRVSSIRWNDRPLKFRAKSKNCLDCQRYFLKGLAGLQPSDTLFITAVGTYQTYAAGTNPYDYKGRIANNRGILRASEQSKWYPVLEDQTANLPSFAQKAAYTYELTANCADCEWIYLGSGAPQRSSAIFRSTYPTKGIMLIAGPYEWVAGDRAIYINLQDSALRTYLDSLFTVVGDYYEQLTATSIPNTFAFAHLPSDNNQWGGFMTYPTVVKVGATIRRRGLPAYLSHEIAHYLFGNHYEPQTNLFWFYLESFAEYFSFKFLLQNPVANHDQLRADFRALQQDQTYQPLNTIRKIEDINTWQRYTVGPFQLLALEQLIGESQMVALVKAVFPRLQPGKEGYTALVESLRAIGISETVITDWENRFVAVFRPEHYTFFEELLLN